MARQAARARAAARVRAPAPRQRTPAGKPTPASKPMPASKPEPVGRKPAPAPRPRRARPADLEALVALEQVCFQPFRRASRASLRRSLASRLQSVWVVDWPEKGSNAAPASKPRAPSDKPGNPPLAALLVLWHFPHRVRVYDVATHPALQGTGLGHRLMAHAEAEARQSGASWLTLEADPKEPGLADWYRRQGFRSVRTLPAYYRNGRAAVRMLKRL